MLLLPADQRAHQTPQGGNDAVRDQTAGARIRLGRNVLDLVPMTGIDIFYLRVALEGGVVALAAFAAFAALAAIPKRASAASPPELSRALMASFLASLVMMFAVSMYYAFFVGFVAVGAAWAMQLDQTPPGETSSANEP